MKDISNQKRKEQWLLRKKIEACEPLDKNNKSNDEQWWHQDIDHDQSDMFMSRHPEVAPLSIIGHEIQKLDTVLLLEKF